MDLISRWWPWSRSTEPIDYTQALVTLLRQYASGQGREADPALAGGVAAAATLYGNAFAACEVGNVSPSAAAALTPAFLGYLGRQYPTRGQAVALIDVVRGELKLRPAQIVDHSQPDVFLTQRVEADVVIQREVRIDELINVVYEQTSDDEIGQPPWSRFQHLTEAQANFERAVSREASVPIRRLPSTPSDSSGDATEELNATLIRELNEGDQIIRPLPAVTDPNAYMPLPDQALPPKSREGVFTKLGPEWDTAVPMIRDGLHSAVAGNLGVPATMTTISASATGLREAHSFFVASAVAPLGRIVQRELRRKLREPDLVLDFSEQAATDYDRRSRAVKNLIDSGVPLPEAMLIAGIGMREGAA